MRPPQSAPGRTTERRGARPAPKPSLFRSFLLGGFEAACHINGSGQRLDMLASTQHDLQVLEDYRLLARAGILAARDGACWHKIDSGGRLDFGSLIPPIQASAAAGIQVIWSLCHYGWPDDLEPFSPEFVPRFEKYASRLARFLSNACEAPRFYVPMNEISYVAYAAGEQAHFHPYLKGKGFELKQRLAAAAIAASRAILDADPSARLVHVDPLIHVVPPRGREDLAEVARAKREHQFQAAEMLCGRMCPELGGAPELLDVMGLNFYHSNQFEHEGERLRWEDEPRDERWVPLRNLLAEVHGRFRRPLFLSETSHFGCGRARWIREILQEVLAARREGVPLEGICFYPVIDRHDWEDDTHWHRSGLWELQRSASGRLLRILDPEYALEVERCMRAIEDSLRY